jgi:hypothetical protein
LFDFFLRVVLGQFLFDLYVVTLFRNLWSNIVFDYFKLKLPRFSSFFFQSRSGLQITIYYLLNNLVPNIPENLSRSKSFGGFKNLNTLNYYT